MAGVNWELGIPRVNVMQAAQEGFAAGREMRREREATEALRALSANPNDRSAAINALLLDPKRASAVIDYGQQMDRRAALNALMPGEPTGQLGAAGAPASRSGMGLNRQALRQLFAIDPDLAMKLRGMDTKQREEARDAIKSNYEMTSRVVAAVRQVPEADRPAAYAELRGELEASGFENLPEAWDEQRADSLMHLGLTAAQVFEQDRGERRLAADLENIEADNARADRNTDSLMRYRQGQLGNAKRGQDIASRDRIRGQDIASTDRRRGQNISASKATRGGPPQLLRSVAQPQPGVVARSPAKSTAPVYATNPQTGERLQLVNGKWVPAR